MGRPAASRVRPGPAHRRPLAGRRASAIRSSSARSPRCIDLVRGLRNARAEAKLEPAAWLPTEVVVPAALGATFEALRPGLEVLARARPLLRRVDRAALTTGAGDAGRHRRRPRGGHRAGRRAAASRRADAAADRARLEKELAEAEGWLAAARDRLANEAFMSKAPPAVVEGARAREAELADQVDRLRERLAD